MIAILPRPSAAYAWRVTQMPPSFMDILVMKFVVRVVRSISKGVAIHVQIAASRSLTWFGITATGYNEAGNHVSSFAVKTLCLFLAVLGDDHRDSCQKEKSFEESVSVGQGKELSHACEFK